MDNIIKGIDLLEKKQLISENNSLIFPNFVDILEDVNYIFLFHYLFNIVKRTDKIKIY